MRPKQKNSKASAERNNRLLKNAACFTASWQLNINQMVPNTQQSE
ncbi:hypothetical protein [Sphingorhabdus sp. 109]|nr:hypothetical protein [Sphingorhabdus sp. 109]